MQTTPQGGPPKLEFSEVAARRAALTEMIQHPMTLVPSAGGLVMGFALGTFSVVSIPAAIGIVTVGVLVGSANFALKFFGGSEAFTQKYYAKIHEEFERMKAEKTAQLADDLNRLGCEQGERQVTELDEKFQNLVAVFRRVLSPTELTYIKFIDTAQLGYRASLDNLDRIVTILMNMKDIDRAEIARRIKVLERKGSNLSTSETQTLDALRRQALVYDSGGQEVENLLAANEIALTTMDEAGAAAVKIKDKSAAQTPQQSLEESLGLLRQMIERANQKSGPTITLDQDKKQ